MRPSDDHEYPSVYSACGEDCRDRNYCLTKLRCLAGLPFRDEFGQPLKITIERTQPAPGMILIVAGNYLEAKAHAKQLGLDTTSAHPKNWRYVSDYAQGLGFDRTTTSIKFVGSWERRKDFADLAALRFRYS